MTPSTTENYLLAEAYKDCIGDLRESSRLLTDAKNRLTRFLKDIHTARSHIEPTTYTEAQATAGQHLKILSHKINAVHMLAARLRHSHPALSLISESSRLKDTVYEYLRTHQTVFGALITSTDWQSPSYDHTVRSQAGRETNTIYATINDYKRDQNWDAYRYEREFIKTNVDAFVKFPIQAIATSSGMAAFSTILLYLLLEKKAKGPVLMGQSSYFQNRILLNPAFAGNIITFDETKTGEIFSLIKNHNPSLLFIDSLTNSPDVAVADIPAVIDYLKKHIRDHTYLVIDNTGLPVVIQPFAKIIGRMTKLHIIMFESLNKYHQFGMDRVTGGIIVSCGDDSVKLFDYRRHGGTNITDTNAASLPSPDRVSLKSRLLRHGRNIRLLAEGLQDWIDSHPSSPFEKIVYPGLSDHPSYGWAQRLPFTGSYAVIGFKQKYRNVPTYKRFLASVMKTARRRHVDITAASSFGLNKTRIYLTALWSRPSTPFIRITAGTENRFDIEAVMDVLKKTFSDFQ